MPFSDAEMTEILEVIRGGKTVTITLHGGRYVTTYAWRDGGWILDCFEEGASYVANIDEVRMRAEIDAANPDEFALLLAKRLG